MKFPSPLLPVRSVAAFSCTVSLALSGCLFGNSDEKPVPSGYLQSSEPYVQVGNTVVLQSKGPDSIRWCDGDELFSEAQPGSEGGILQFELKKDSLFFIHYTRYHIGDAGMENYSIYVRTAGGPALEGTWSWKGDAFRLVQNSLIPAEKAYYDSLTEASRAEALAYPVTLEFTGALFKTVVTRTPADDYLNPRPENEGFGIPGWFTTEYYAITLRKLDANTIEVKGAKTGAAFLKLRLNSAGDITYSSSDPKQAPQTYFANPRSCPNLEFPDWVLDFLNANLVDVESVP